MYKILIADDDDISRSMLKAILEADEYEITLAKDGFEAMDYLRQENFACLLLDLHMPGRDGIEVLEYLRGEEKLKNLPVVVISSDDSVTIKDRVFQLGVLDVIQKPFNRNLISRRVEHIILLNEQTEQVSKFKKQLEYDFATGLLNKKAFFSVVEAALKDKERGAFYMVDIDGLKYINDTMGHVAGDLMISSFGKLLDRHFGGDSILGHLSGDEFAVYLPGIVTEERAIQEAQKLIKTIRQDFSIPDQTRMLSASIGICLYPTQAETISALYTNADYAMLFVKNNGRDGYHMYERRDNLQKEAAGRIDCTYSDITPILRGRRGEEEQLWVKYGHFRMIWNTFKLKKTSAVGAALLTIRRKNHSIDMDKANLVAITEEITQHIKLSEHPGVFAWYSANELLVLDYESKELKEFTGEVSRYVSSKLERAGLEMVERFSYIGTGQDSIESNGTVSSELDLMKGNGLLSKIAKLLLFSLLDVNLETMEYKLYSYEHGGKLINVSSGNYNDEIQRFLRDQVHKDDRESVVEVESPKALLRYADSESTRTTKFREAHENGWEWMESMIMFDTVEGVKHALIIDRNIHEQEIAMQNLENYKETKQQNAKLKARHIANQRLLDTLATLVESRDTESGEHIMRIKNYTEILAVKIMEQYPEYGLDEDKVSHIVSAASMHDVGKIAIPDKILLKPGKLTPEEFETMKKHSNRGGEIIRKIAYMQDDEYTSYCYDVATYHHERFDGGGYPNGLVGDEIPISAQIVSIADVYDALVNIRPYKDAYTPEQAFDMVMNGQCGVFNPKLLKCLEESKEEFQRLAQGIKDEEMLLNEDVKLNGKTILVVENSIADRKAITETVTKMGGNVVVAKGGAAAVKLLGQSNEGYFSMMFVDLSTPDLDGYAVAKATRLLSRFDVKKLPIVAISSMDTAKIREMSRDAGLDYTLVKPMEEKKLSACLAKCLNNKF